MNLKIILTPIGHYFLGGERNFTFDSEIRRQYSEGYFIHSKEIPSQTSLFGTLRYLLGVKDEHLIPTADKIIGPESFSLLKDNQHFGKIRSISPIFLMNDERGRDVYYVRAPFDHNNDDKSAQHYQPLEQQSDAEVYRFPESSLQKKARLISGYKAKSGIFHGWISLAEKQIIPDTEIFVKSVEVVSNKAKKLSQGNDDDAFAKKEFIRMRKGYHLVFFADVDDCSFPAHTAAVIGKGNSIFDVRISESDEEQKIQTDIQNLFYDRPADFIYCVSDCYVSDGIGSVYKQTDTAIVETQTMRIFETVDGHLRPSNKEGMINLIRAGSVLYCRDSSCLKNSHAAVAGMNNIVTGGL